MQRKDFLTEFLGALGAMKIDWTLEASESIAGTMIYEENDPEEAQDFIWHISEKDLPKREVYDLVQILNEQMLLDIDRIRVSRKELRAKLSSKYGRVVSEQDFLGALNSLKAVEVRMVDDGKETDIFFIHE